MTTIAIAAAPARWRTAMLIAAGLLVGVGYTLSPLTVLGLAALVWVTSAASRGLSADERRWYWSIISISVVIRLVAIGLLFYTADPARPFASFFGDEELYKFRTMWLRNVGQGIAMSPADVIYTFDDVGHTSYMYVLAFVQALVGDAPYGLHVMNMLTYFCGTLALYRLARASYGGVVAMGGLIVLLFLPSLGLWSISVLKEPMNVLMIAIDVVAVVAIVRAPRWWQKVLALIVVAVAAGSMESLRTGGRLTAMFGTVVGLSTAFIVSRGRRLAFALIAVPIVIAMAAVTPGVQERVLRNVREGAFYHAGHVLTFGYSYRLVDPSYYTNRRQLLNNMPPEDAGRFAVKAIWSYFAQPLPWAAQSRTMLAYIPEQIIWYLLALLLPFGIYSGMKRDIVLTSVLAAHAVAAILIIALSSGNIGTLIRHRALALPYIVWLSAVGAHEWMCRIAERSRRTQELS